MKRWVPSSKTRAIAGASLCAAASFGSASAWAQAAVGVDAGGEYIRGRVIVGARGGVPAADVDRLASGHGGRAVRLGVPGLYVLQLPPTASETAVQQQLARNPKLKFAELDRRVKPALVPNDPYLNIEWHVTKIGAYTAWDYAMGSGVTIAILDTGMESAHPDLAAQAVSGWNAYDGSSNTSETIGHGTGVAGVAGGTLNNATGVAAIAGRASLMPIRIGDASGGASWSTVAQAITYAADRGAKVANLSYENMAGSSTVQSAAQYMKNKGGLVVVAAGNTAKDEGFAATTTLIPVSATDQNDALTTFSSYGNYVAISAPGIDIPTTVSGGGYSRWAGTSVATPVVSGTIALMMSANPSLSNTQIESLLYSTAVDLGAPGRDKYFGYGRVDAAAAVKAAIGQGTPAPDTTPPTVAIAAPVAGATVSGAVPIDVSAADKVGVTKVELRVNGALVGTDTASPYGFSWDSTGVPNGPVTLTASAYDAAGNVGTSTSVQVNVSNISGVADGTPPTVAFVAPTATDVRRTVSISTSASDNAGAAGVTQQLFIDGVLKATVTGGSLSYSWNSRKAALGPHTLQVVAKDQAGNTTTKSMQVNKVQ